MPDNPSRATAELILAELAERLTVIEGPKHTASAGSAIEARLPKSMRTTLTVGRFQERTEALGPGVRAVVWFHGCSLRCPGCIAQEMNESTDFSTWSPLELAERVCAVAGIEGVTLSGGDPFDQPLGAFYEFLGTIRKLSQLSVLCYTGRTLSQLRTEFPLESLEPVLANVDVLVDGPYVEALNDGVMWRGSSNQTIHFLTPRYAHLRDMVNRSHERGIEVRVAGGQGIEITGIPPKGFMDSFARQLGKRGLVLDFETQTERLLK